MNAIVARNCGECTHSGHRRGVLCRCSLLDIDVVPEYIDRACPLVVARIVSEVTA